MLDSDRRGEVYGDEAGEWGNGLASKGVFGGLGLMEKVCYLSKGVEAESVECYLSKGVEAESVEMRKHWYAKSRRKVG